MALSSSSSNSSKYPFLPFVTSQAFVSVFLDSFMVISVLLSLFVILAETLKPPCVWEAAPP